MLANIPSKLPHCLAGILRNLPMNAPSAPFIAVDGVFNFRDIGGYASSQDPTLSVPRGRVFRCAAPGRVTPSGTQQIRDLGITKVFDLRSRTEIERTADFGPVVDIVGIERVSVPVYVDSEYPSHQSVKNLENYISANRHVSFEL